jgi:hypothetical protein
MKKLLLIFCGPIFIAAFLYTAFAFYTWQFNPAYWGANNRITCGFLIVAFTLIFEYLVFNEVDEDELNM